MLRWPSSLPTMPYSAQGEIMTGRDHHSRNGRPTLPGGSRSPAPRNGESAEGAFRTRSLSPRLLSRWSCGGSGSSSSMTATARYMRPGSSPDTSLASTNHTRRFPAATVRGLRQKAHTRARVSAAAQRGAHAVDTSAANPHRYARLGASGEPVVRMSAQPPFRPRAVARGRSYRGAELFDRHDPASGGAVGA
jgi:hypothetical protein